MHSLLALVALLTPSIITRSSSQSIDPQSVDNTTRAKWCNDQQSTCPLLCLQIRGASKTPSENTCDPVTLNYLCVCSNGQQPNASEYSLTIPYHECQEFGNQCVKKCSDTDSACQSACYTDHPCGAQNPTRVNTSSITTSTAAATSSSENAASTSDSNPADYTGFGPNPTATPTSASGGSGSGSGGSNSAQTLMIGFGRTYGLALILAIVCGGFTFML